jgi:hypothetical protein
MFSIRIIKVQRVNDGCTVEADSATVRFKLSSGLPAPCAMLRAGETYKAFRATAQTDPKNEASDAAILVVYNNVKNIRRDNSAFDIDSEQALTKKFRDQ